MSLWLRAKTSSVEHFLHNTTGSSNVSSWPLALSLPPAPPPVSLCFSSATTILLLLPLVPFIPIPLWTSEPLSVWDKDRSTQNPPELERPKKRGETGCSVTVCLWLMCFLLFLQCLHLLYKHNLIRSHFFNFLSFAPNLKFLIVLFLFIWSLPTLTTVFCFLFFISPLSFVCLILPPLI